MIITTFGSVHLMVQNSFLWKSAKKIQPFPCILGYISSSYKENNHHQTFCSILYMLHRPFNNAFLPRGWIWCFNFKNLQASIGYHMPSPSVETIGWFSWIFIKLSRNLSATTNMFLSLDMLCARISLSSDSIAIHHNQMYSDPIFIMVSSIINSEILFLLDNISWGLYFWFHFHMETWLLLLMIYGEKIMLWRPF